MTRAYINSEMLIWARKRSGLSVADLSRKCGVSQNRLEEWEAGQKEISFAQAQKFADKVYIPFGYLFLPIPPEEHLPIPDLRTVNGQEPAKPSAELLDIVKIMLQRQDWYKDYLRSQLATPNKVVARLSAQSGVDLIVKDMRKVLDVPAYPHRGTWQDYYKTLVSKIEAVGVLVMRQSSIGHHSRALNVEEFRGFAIADDYAPIIFINHADTLGARLFTLIHELCHIWIGQSGISDTGRQGLRAEEVLCNAVAAEFLVPEKEFLGLWKTELDTWESNLPLLESHFHVSTWTLARRALSLSLITHDEYTNCIADKQRAYRKREAQGGPSYYQTKKAQISGLFSRAVVTEALNGQLLLREASHLLDGIKPANIANFARELGV